MKEKALYIKSNIVLKDDIEIIEKTDGKIEFKDLSQNPKVEFVNSRNELDEYMLYQFFSKLVNKKFEEELTKLDELELVYEDSYSNLLRIKFNRLEESIEITTSKDEPTKNNNIRRYSNSDFYESLLNTYNNLLIYNSVKEEQSEKPGR